MTRVWSSVAVMLETAVMRNPQAPRTARARSIDHLASAAVTGLPSANFAPDRRWNV